ncbi:MAG: PAS domain S-box protein, partial [Coprothermobacterota bacterium]|nr:PAS domain S-box protein [Coprothermobacterota bacterium]
MSDQQRPSEQPGAAQWAEKALLRKSEGQKDAILNSITASIAFVDVDLRLLWVNVAAAKSVNKSPAEMIGQTCHAFWADPAKPCENCPTVRAFQTKQTEHTFMYTPDGRVRDEKGEPVFDERGDVIGVVETAQDITERVRAEEALRQVSEWLLLATHSGGVGIWDLDVVNNKLTWDDQMFRLYGITPDHFDGAYETWKARVHPEDQERCDAEVQIALRGENEYDTEFRVVRPNGAIRHIRARASMHRDAAGQPARLIGTNYDITERKQAEETLRNSEEKYRKLIENSHDIIYTLTADGVFIFVSPAWTALLGHPANQVAGQPFQQFVHPDDLPGCMVF